MRYIIAILLLTASAFAEPINPDDADVGEIAIQLTRQGNRIDKLETDVASIKQRLNTGIQVPAGAVEAPPNTPTGVARPAAQPPYQAPQGFTWMWNAYFNRWELVGSSAPSTISAPAPAQQPKSKWKYEPEPGK